MGAGTAYTKLEQMEDGMTVSVSERYGPKPNVRPWSRAGTAAGYLFLFIFALYGLVTASSVAVVAAFPAATGSFHPYIKWGWIHTPHRRSCRCGSTLAEAKANGCSYDSLGLAWLPAHCQDRELLAEWERAGPGPNGAWQYWADKNGTIPMTLDEIAELGGRPIGQGWFWMTQAWHIKHCAFAWRKLARAPVTGVTVERSSSGLEHIGHCEKEFLRQVNSSTIMTRAGVSLDGDYQETRHMTEEDYWEIPA